MNLHWGILGAAAIATRSVIPAILSVPGNTLAGIGSRTMQKGAEAARGFDCRAYDGYDALLQDETINAVYIPLPTGMHHEWVLKALQAGKHVLVEKAAAVNSAEAAEMTALSREKNLALVENFQFTRHSQHDAVKKLLADGAIGELRCFRASFGFPPFDAETNIRYQKKLGGGALLDAGAYTLRVASFFLGENLQVAAARLVENPEMGVDWYGGAFLTRKDSPVFAELAFGFDNFYQCNYELWGSKGKLTATRAYTARADFQPSILLEQGSGTEEIKLPADDHFRKMIFHFGQTIAEGNLEPERQNILTQAALIEATRRTATGT